MMAYFIKTLTYSFLNVCVQARANINKLSKIISLLAKIVKFLRLLQQWKAKIGKI